MNINEYINCVSESPLDNIVINGGYTGIFRKIAVVGDSLASGEFENIVDGEKSYHDYLDYSWGQYLARDVGCKVYNFSRGGMTAKEYIEEFADLKNYWDLETWAQAYIIALGVNDITRILKGELNMGNINDINHEDYKKNAKTFVGFYAGIIQKYKLLQPNAQFFLITIPHEPDITSERDALCDEHEKLVCEIAELFDNCNVINLRKYAPVYDAKFKEKFYLGGHMNATGYRLTALMVESYIDYIVRNKPDKFKKVGFIGTPYI